jgi:hypothetical protein
MVLSSEEGRDAVQLMLKVSESNNHAELEKMKLSLLVKAKQEVLEQRAADIRWSHGGH